jgi:hypothetical protein
MGPLSIAVITAVCEDVLCISTAGRDEIHGDVCSNILGIHGRYVQPVLVL